MKSYLDLSFRYLKKQKRRTFLTLCGIVMSAALITGTGTIIESLKGQIRENTVKNTGNFHVCFKNVTSEQASVIASDPAVFRSCSGRIDGFAVLAETGNEDIPYRLLRLDLNDENALDMQDMNDRLLQGRLPREEGEIALEERAMKILGDGYSRGSTLTLTVGQRRRVSDDSIITDFLYPLSLKEDEDDREEYFQKTGERTFQITGILSDQVYISDNNSVNGVIFGDLAAQGSDMPFHMLVLLHEPGEAEYFAETLADAMGLNRTDILYNHRLLSLTGHSLDRDIRRSLGGFQFIIVGIIVLATIAVIYNSFNISLLERISQLGVMRCIGASPSQIRKMILQEAGLMSLVAVPPGIAIGLFAMKILFRVVDSLSSNQIFEGLTIVLSPGVILTAACICTGSVFFSALFPALQAGRIAPVEAVRGTNIYRHDRARPGRRPDRRPRLFGRSAGFSLLMAFRNIGRNRKRFLTTLFSMVISVMLFVSFGGLLRLVSDLNLVSSDLFPGICLRADDKIEEDIHDEIGALPGVDLQIKYGQAGVSLLLREDLLSSHYREHVDGLTDFPRRGNSVVIPDSRIVCYGDDALEELKEHLVSGELSPVMVVGKSLFRNDKGKRVYAPGTMLQAGDEISLLGEEGIETVIAVGGVLDDAYYQDFNEIEGGIDLIVSEEIFAGLTGRDGFTEVYIRLDKEGDKIDVISYLERLVNVRIGYSYVDSQRQAEEMYREGRAINIFFYGFIIVISLISCLNVINTISTNLLIRSREFGIIQAVGMDERGLGRMVLIESVIFSLASLTAGSLLGSGFWYLLVRQLSNIRVTLFQLPLREIGLAAAMLFVLTLSSGYFPLKNHNRRTIMDNIRIPE